MAGRPSRVREAIRRLAAGIGLTLAAGVGVNEDLHGLPDARRGARQVRLPLPHLGTTSMHVPQATPSGVVLLLHRNAAPRELAALAGAVPWHALLVDVDVTRLGSVADACEAIAARLEDISRRAQRDAGLRRYLRPVLLAAPTARPIAAAALAGSHAGALPVAVAAGPASDRAPTPACTGRATRLDAAEARGSRWYTPPHPGALAPLVDHALTTAADAPAADGTPVERWLRHFDLPMTAAWSSNPRAMLVLLSPARGWREPEHALAQRLARAGVHVVGIDALQSFWQRRSPRDVAFELQRLTDALASAGLPVYIGGRGFGAETMAVAGEMMASTRTVAGVVLMDPGPSAFFEVEPPALALRPLGPRDWSTRRAILGLDRPTLCVTHAPSSSSALLCSSLARQGRATFATTADEASALAAAITTFIFR